MRCNSHRCVRCGAPITKTQYENGAGCCKVCDGMITLTEVNAGFSHVIAGHGLTTRRVD